MTPRPAPKKFPVGLLIGCIVIFCVVLFLALSIGAFSFFRSNTAAGPSLAVATRVSDAITTPMLESAATEPAPTLPLTPTETAVSPTETPAPRAVASSAPAVAPGIYVTGLRTSPSPPVRRQDVTFIVRFLNSTAAPFSYRLVVYLYRPDQSNSFGETPAFTFNVPRGTSEVESGAWRLTGPGGCEEFMVRVGWLNDNKRATLFTRVDGKNFEQPINVCP